MKDELDDRGHEALTQAILARTSRGGCAAARDRLCDFVDGALGAIDRDLVGGHLDHCPACSELAAAIAETATVLPSFATLSPRYALVPAVLAATSRRGEQPALGERVAAWLSRAAARPRFALEAAYVLTVLLLVVVGNPVHAFKEASMAVQPRVTSVRSAVAAPIERLRTAGEEKLNVIGQAIAPKGKPATSVDVARAALWQWWRTWVDGPVRSFLTRASAWSADVANAFWKAMGGSDGEPAGRPTR